MPADSSYTKNLTVTWDEFHRQTRILADKLNGIGTWPALVAVTRGGLVPAAIIARELRIRLVDTLCVASYGTQTGAEQEKMASEILKQVSIPVGDGGEGLLIIDDLVDTGDTAMTVRTMLPRAHVATVYAKPAGRGLVDTFVTEVPQDTWILFPWDIAPQFADPIKPVAADGAPTKYR